MDDYIKITGTKDLIYSTWTHNNESTLVHALKMAKDKGKWRDNDPKDLAYTVYVELEALSYSWKKSGGIPKVAKAIKNRWQCVHAHTSCIVHAFTIPLAHPNTVATLTR